MKRLLKILSFAICFFFALASAGKNEHGHGHDHEEPQKTQAIDYSEHDDHEHDEGNESEHGHDHDEENGHEKSAQVGPDKGILEASETNGIRLSQEAEKNFEIARLRVNSSGPVELPKTAVVTAVSEVNVFRYRGGFYKRVDFREVRRLQDKIFIKSKDLKNGDEIVIRGLGYLRIAEIAAFGGAPEGHSH